MRPLLVLALAVVPLLAAGCVGTALATAMEARHPADEAARLWNRDAQLAGALGIEGTGPLAVWAVAFVTQQEIPREGKDEKVGDGRAEAWAYKYVAPGLDEAYVVVIDETGAVRSARPEARKGGEAALADWRVDSDDGLRIARETNQGIREGTEQDQHGIVLALVMDDGAPVWHVLAGGRAEGANGGGYVKLHAGTGEVLSSVGGFRAR